MEDREDLRRVMIDEHPFTRNRERNTLERLLEWDDRNIGFCSKKIEVSPEDYETKIDYTDIVYSEEEENYRRFIMGRLLDCKKFDKMWDEKLMKGSPALARHKTKWLEEQYEKYYSQDGSRKISYWYHLALNLRAALKCLGLTIMHILHALIPIRITSHH